VIYRGLKDKKIDKDKTKGKNFEAKKTQDK